MVRADRVVIEATLVQPLSNGSTLRTTQHALANAYVPLDRDAGFRSLRGQVSAGLWSRRGERQIGRQTRTVSEPADRVDPIAGRNRHYQVDRVAAMISRPTAPTLMTLPITKHRDRRMLVNMIGNRAMPPPPNPNPTRGHRKLIQQRGKIRAIEHILDPPSRCSQSTAAHRHRPFVVFSMNTKGQRDPAVGNRHRVRRFLQPVAGLVTE
jgi:hypothetical protein